MTTIEDLRNEWAARDAKLEAMLRLNTKLMRESWQDKKLAKVRDGGYGVAEVIVSVVALALLGSFAAAHLGEWRFFLPAAALHLWTVVMLAAGIRQRMVLRQIDYSGPVVELQRRLAELRSQRLFTFKWAFLTGQLLWWIPLMIVLFKGALGVDLYTVSDFMPRFMAINMLGGLAFIPLGIWLAARYGSSLQRFAAVRYIVDSLTGSDLRKASAFLDRLARFESEAEAA